MTSKIESIYSGCKTQIQTALGVSYSELLHVYDLEKNTYETAVLRWGLIPERVDFSPTDTRNISQDAYFSLVITDEYGSIEETDASLRSKQMEIMGKFESVWVRLTQQKAGIASDVMLVSGFSITRADILEKTRIVWMMGQFFVRFRNNF